MDRTGKHEYARLTDGGCFGEISIVEDMPNEFNYYYDNHSEEPLQCLIINSNVFKKILEKHPLELRVFKEMALKKANHLRACKM